MRTWKWEEPADDHSDDVAVQIITDDEIEALYYDWWLERMAAKFGEGRFDASVERAIEDFVTTHWAWEI